MCIFVGVVVKPQKSFDTCHSTADSRVLLGSSTLLVSRRIYLPVINKKKNINRYAV